MREREAGRHPAESESSSDQNTSLGPRAVDNPSQMTQLKLAGVRVPGWLLGSQEPRREVREISSARGPALRLATREFAEGRVGAFS